MLSNIERATYADGMPVPTRRLAGFSNLRRTASCLVLLVALASIPAGCSDAAPNAKVEKPATSTLRDRHAETAPADSRPDDEPLPSKPATQPQGEVSPPRPAAPASTYDSKPPYPVDLHVNSADDSQPGWLRIVQLDVADAPAAAHGEFPEQNVMVVDTQNVRRLEVRINDLPMAEKKRIILRLDGQGIELIRGNRRSVILERRATGAWGVVGSH